MQISTKVFNEQSIAGFQRLGKEIQDDQKRIATGSRILNASDDPVTMAQVSAANDQLAKIEQYDKNVDRARLRLTQAETALESVESMVTRLIELSLQAMNGTYGEAGRTAIKAEVISVKDAIREVANSTDPHGNALFGGFKRKTVPFVQATDGTVSYDGDRGISFVPISETMKIQASVDGATAFNRIPTTSGYDDLFGIIDSIVTNITNNNPGQISVDNLKSSLSHVSKQRALMGSQINKADSQLQLLQQRKMLLTESIGEMRDTDLSEVVTRLKSLMLSRDAAQQAFSMIGRQSLFDFIR